MTFSPTTGGACQSQFNPHPNSFCPDTLRIERTFEEGKAAFLCLYKGLRIVRCALLTAKTVFSIVINIKFNVGLSSPDGGYVGMGNTRIPLTKM